MAESDEVLVTVVLKCPQCQEAIKVPTQYFGQTVLCPHCQGAIELPTPKRIVVEEERSTPPTTETESVPQQVGRAIGTVGWSLRRVTAAQWYLVVVVAVVVIGGLFCLQPVWLFGSKEKKEPIKRTVRPNVAGTWDLVRKAKTYTLKLSQSQEADGSMTVWWPDSADASTFSRRYLSGYTIAGTVSSTGGDSYPVKGVLTTDYGTKVYFKVIGKISGYDYLPLQGDKVYYLEGNEVEAYFVGEIVGEALSGTDWTATRL